MRAKFIHGLWYGNPEMEKDCNSCGWCCLNGVDVTPEEKHLIAAYTKMDPSVFVKGDSTKVVDGKCIFLKFEGGRNKCLIYEVRPADCKNYEVQPDCRPDDYMKMLDKTRWKYIKKCGDE